MKEKLVSGLKISTLKKYAKSKLLERDDTGYPMYFHSLRAFHPCDFCCNGQHGEDIASDIHLLESQNEKE